MLSIQDLFLILNQVSLLILFISPKLLSLQTTFKNTN
jgi:hypothetical protein